MLANCRGLVHPCGHLVARSPAGAPMIPSIAHVAKKLFGEARTSSSPTGRMLRQISTPFWSAGGVLIPHALAVSSTAAAGTPKKTSTKTLDENHPEHLRGRRWANENRDRKSAPGDEDSDEDSDRDSDLDENGANSDEICDRDKTLI